LTILPKQFEFDQHVALYGDRKQVCKNVNGILVVVAKLRLSQAPRMPIMSVLQFNNLRLHAVGKLCGCVPIGGAPRFRSFINTRGLPA
jgi:hypothetical protein